MNVESQVKASRTAIVLTTAKDWEGWILQRSITARSLKIWEYVNPDLPASKVRDIDSEEPQERPRWTFKQPPLSQPEDDELVTFTPEEREQYKDWQEVYNKRYKDWEKKYTGLTTLSYEISQTVNTRHIHMLSVDKNAYQQLVALKARFCPTVSERHYQLRARYQAVRTRPKRGNIETWLDEWVAISELLTTARMPEADTHRLQDEFLMSVRDISDSWSMLQMDKIREKEEEGEPYATIDELVRRFRSIYQTMQPVASSIGTFAILGVAEETA